MTVLDWLKNKHSYSTITDGALKIIAFDNGIADAESAFIADTTLEQRELMEADLIIRAIILSPSGTASRTISHAGFSKTLGGEQDSWRAYKLKWAKDIYKKYGKHIPDEHEPIGQIKISDVI